MSNKTNPGRLHSAVTPSNTTVLVGVHALYCTVAGDAVVEDKDGTQVTYTLTAGQILPFEAYRVRTGTTATVVAWRY